ncbi:MAG: DUF4129 domain-containing protein [Firmicutes bacterium]|nr:DUF4129 domain-containing protein [Bacillota bacterium]
MLRRRLIARSLQSLLLLLLLLPLFLVPSLYLAASEPDWASASLLSMAGMAVIAVATTRFLRKWHASLTLLLCALLDYFVPSLFAWRPLPLYVVLLIIASLVGVLTERRQEPDMPPQVFWLGLFLYFATAVASRYLNALHPLFPALDFAAVVCVAATLFAINRRYLETESTGADGAPPSKTLVRHNRLYVAAILLIVLILGAISVLFQLVGRVIQWAAGVITDLFLWVLHQPHPSGSVVRKTSGHPTERKLPSVPTSHAGLGTIVGRDILLGLLTLAFLYACYRLLRHVPAWWRYLAKWLAPRDLPDGSYIDHTEAIVHVQHVSPLFNLRRLIKRKQRPKDLDWADLLDSEQRVRWLYRRLLTVAIQRGYTYRPELTAQEAVKDLMDWLRAHTSGEKIAALSIDNAESASDLQEATKINSLASAYDTVRYGAKPWPDDAVEALRSVLLQLE